MQLKRFQKDPVYVVNCIQLPISNTSQNKEAFGGIIHDRKLNLFTINNYNL